MDRRRARTFPSPVRFAKGIPAVPGEQTEGAALRACDADSLTGKKDVSAEYIASKEINML